MSVNEEGLNKCRNVEDTSSSMNGTSEKNNNDMQIFEIIDILTVKNKKFYDQLIKDNAKFLECLEFLCSRIKFLEKNIEHDNFMNNSFIKHLTKKVAKISINIKFYDETNKLQWTNLYNEKIQQKAKEVLFTYFRADALLPINTSSSPQKITEWKTNPSVAECYHELFNKERNSDLLVKVLRKVFASKNSPFLHIAFVTATFVVLLNLKSKTICTNESVMRNKIDYFMEKLKNTDHFEEV
ncbi:hypothetical protein C1645_816586 [Glomus cerebriforme]|uniref:Uncharacterized protein n=1 Tax=Glomus cerebriforme TaxID=658196 RepID=A0A397TKG5_9GLOM|nr:hypothetical protein C1645_816586 [Glomus cerebriforme]